MAISGSAASGSKATFTITNGGGVESGGFFLQIEEVISNTEFKRLSSAKVSSSSTSIQAKLPKVYSDTNAKATLYALKSKFKISVTFTITKSATKTKDQLVTGLDTTLTLDSTDNILIAAGDITNDVKEVQKLTGKGDSAAPASSDPNFDFLTK